MVKTVGGNSYISAFVDEMSKGVVGGMEQTAGGKKMLKLKGKHGGSVELSPLLVSLMTLGMRVASDPKLSETYKKHTKMSGGADILANEYEKNMTISGGGASGIYDMFASALNTASIVGGRSQKVKKMARGGTKETVDPVGFDNCRYDIYEQPPAVPAATPAAAAASTTGGRKRKQVRRNKKIYGGEGEEMPDVDIPSDDVVQPDDVVEPESVEIVDMEQSDMVPPDDMDIELPEATDTSTTTGGAKKRSRKIPVKKASVKKATRGGEAMMSEMDMQTAGRRKSKKAVRGGSCNQSVETAAAEPVVQTAGRRKTKKSLRGGGCNDIWANLPTLDISAGGAKRANKGRKTGGNLEAKSLMPTNFKY